ncbi:hypothetical protein rv5_gp171 [Escherichia phage V5]|uniref:Phage protein n=2 Tax=Vequintavirus V5 TaxID=1914853 RepID=B3RGW0_9CAUD|nr:hypothetical protein rv5_gp171 [Escherichia phage V5]ABI79241.1 hypothetical protein [Escherichia phage V5]AKE45730.1 hypothetical protein ECTP5_00863 [Escherichia coli O157 typing phage 5]
MAIVTVGDVVEMEAKYLKAGMHILRNDQELLLTMVDYNPGQDYPSIDILFEYVDEELKEDEAYQGEFCNFFCPDEVVKVIYQPGVPFPLHAINK